LIDRTKALRIKDYRHDRSRRTDQAVLEIHEFIDSFTNQKILNGWYAWFETHFGIPHAVVRQFFNKYLADNFDYLHRCGFKQNLLPLAIPKFIALYIGFVGYVAWYRRKIKADPVQVDLILDHIEWSDALIRFQKLIKLFGQDRVAAVVPGNQEVLFEQIKIFNRPKYKGLCINGWELWKMIFGIHIHLRYSVKAKVNLFGAAIHILHSYFYHRSLFEVLKGKYCIIYQHYNSDAIKNYLFKQMGGIISAVIQKNILQFGNNSFYCDTDIFFALGEKTSERALKLGARIDNIVPVGSFFMEYHWFSRKEKLTEIKWDILNFGGNAHRPKTYCDIYNSHNDDYLEHLLWMVRLAKEYPSLRVGFKHHSNYRFEPIEERAFLGSNVKLIDKELDSYQLAFQSKIIVSWASTMVHEMIGHGKPAFYLNPKGRNDQFVDRYDTTVSITKYEEFKRNILKILSEFGKLESHNAMGEKYCLKSNNVSDTIKNSFDVIEMKKK
jgi:hypothetical protein